ncbi:MAG TPA: hypothetical protein VKF59_14180 [Candidatus Dormibacteraeota bacterium]|nr:hypothetical protein [Candidatus Dormibacteraeota bacterium]
MADRPRRTVQTMLALAMVLAGAASGCTAAGDAATRPATAPTLSGSPAALTLPSLKGINYDGPAGAGGEWLGTRWLRPGDGGWKAAAG